MITFSGISKNKNRSSVVTIGNSDIGPYYWVGNCSNGIDYYAGQTFITPVDGILKNIRLFSPVVHGAATATLSVYEFDDSNHTWKEKKADSIKRITKAMENQWLEFDLPELPVFKNGSYAFKLSCSGDGMVAIAECPWTVRNPYKEGIEWVGSSYFKEGKFQEDFDFAFTAEIETSTYAKFI